MSRVARWWQARRAAIARSNHGMDLGYRVSPNRERAIIAEARAAADSIHAPVLSFPPPPRQRRSA